MEVSSTFYIVLPIVSLIGLLLLIGLPLLANSYDNRHLTRRSPSAPAAGVGHVPRAGREAPAASDEHSPISSAPGSGTAAG
jgi:hypothetical protein